VKVEGSRASAPCAVRIEGRVLLGAGVALLPELAGCATRSNAARFTSASSVERPAGAGVPSPSRRAARSAPCACVRRISGAPGAMRKDSLRLIVRKSPRRLIDDTRTRGAPRSSTRWRRNTRPGGALTLEAGGEARRV